MSGPPVPFSSLPLDKSDSSLKLNAWGLYGPDDQLGFLNRQTDEIVAAAAASEIKTGERVSLDAPMDFQNHNPLFQRQKFIRDVYQKAPRCIHDDVWVLNTQSSTQWDGLRHFGYQQAQRFYNGVTLEDIAGTSQKAKEKPNILGIHNSVKKGITGRGILVDFRRWMEKGPGKDIVKEGKFESFRSTDIKLEWMLETLKWQNGTQPKFGDVLFIRSGFFKSFRELTALRKHEVIATIPHHLGGVEPTDDMLEWIWNNFSAVAADQPAFEKTPMPAAPGIALHEVLLGGWGCHIGELFDLDALSETCERLGRWSFFVSSVPVNVPGGVASPPNAIAIF